ncbi:MAG: hypothetical protein A2314_06225 [Elusimicrobia bacterium RIFOXYB2_FULL_50_12]|nr:MAG: hypothetical protein A2314_06225 [Elusimicrobia bacterium RIFOXYB2_FULL_50_12]
MKKVYVAFVWHQHQPVYKNPVSGIYELPWVRLHATKDYYDTVAILDEFPQIKSTFNLVPSLLAQLSEYSQGAARDKYLDLSVKNATDLDETERVFILLNFFMANWETMINPYPRYRQLLEKRGRNVSFEELGRIQGYFKPAEIRDLQVWFNLAWMDPYWRAKDEFIKMLYDKGRDFTEEDKAALIARQLEICGLVAGKYRQMQDRGQIEVSTTPFYHPILPLLCDTNNALIASPSMTLPKKRFQHREDAKIHIHKAIDYYQRTFGRPPRGMWPSEGSVADEIVPLVAEAGIKWIATDESILFRSIPEYNGSRRRLYEPYKLDILTSQVNVIFRDHALSDTIGFVYSRWNHEIAVADFMKRLYAIRDMLNDSSQNHIIPIILDGENCWEYYSNDGNDFLKLLYQTISNDPTIETTTVSDFMENNPPRETIRKIWAGSWINGDYGIWIGHPEDNLAWDYLSETRKFLSDYMVRHPEKSESPEVKAAWEKIYIAEGSDWNWWFGDDHSSGNDAMFDFLFRQNLISVYDLLHEKAPDHLHKAIKGITRKAPTHEPIDFITARIDGKVTNYFEWQAAGCYEVGHSGGSMHQVETVLNSFHYGFDMENLYFRFDINTPIAGEAIEEITFKVVFHKPEDTEISLSLKNGGGIKEFFIKSSRGVEPLEHAAALKIIEFAVPLSRLELPEDLATIEYAVVVLKNGQEIERWPYESSVIMPRPSPEFELKTWSV